MKAQFTGERIVSADSEAFTLYEKSSFGEKVNGKIEYGLAESLFLVNEGKLEVFVGSKKIGFDDFVKKIKRLDKRIETKFSVFSDLRKKGYVVKTALKFGADFRVYGKGVKPGQDHARWILYAVKEHDQYNWQDFSAKNRVANSTKKKLLLGVVDEESDVTYYEVSWVKP